MEKDLCREALCYMFYAVITTLFYNTSSLLASFTCYVLAPGSHPLVVWNILYQRNCTVELLIRILPLLYALMRVLFHL